MLSVSGPRRAGRSVARDASRGTPSPGRLLLEEHLVHPDDLESALATARAEFASAQNQAAADVVVYDALVVAALTGAADPTGLKQELAPSIAEAS